MWRIINWFKYLIGKGEPAGNDPGTQPVLPYTKTFAYQYNGDFVDRDRDYHFLDIWNYSKEDIESASAPIKVGYFSCHYEGWRDDAGKFKSDWLLKGLDDWENESILNPRYINQYLPIMEKRIVLAKKKGFNAIEFDNTDAWYWFVSKSHRQDCVNYYNELKHLCTRHGMLCGLKNSSFMFPDVKPDFIICEQAFQYNEIESYLQFGVPVFNIEYTRRNFNKALEDPRVFSMMKHKIKMDAWEELL